MLDERIIEILENEITCVKNNSCQRLECADCPLVMEESEILEALSTAIKSVKILSKIRELLGETE